ncbi:hypothetical protein BGZ79_006771 [Entomortierella chlamydospora]|nr:hypothetical protein BGZ79_006771 [Entomortierella chlamydospora]
MQPALTTDTFVGISIRGKELAIFLTQALIPTIKMTLSTLTLILKSTGTMAMTIPLTSQILNKKLCDSSVEGNNPKIDSVAEFLENNTIEASTEDEADEAADVSNLSEDKEAPAINLASTIVSAQLQDYSWIELTVPEAKIRESVGGHRIKKEDYDYLPWVFHVDKEDFELWKDRDASNHFFIWNERNSRANSGNKVNDDFNTNDEDVDNNKSKLNSFQLYFRHCAGHPRKKKVKNQDQSEELEPIERPAGKLAERPAKKTRMVLKPSKKVGCKTRQIVHDVKSDMNEYASKG